MLRNKFGNFNVRIMIIYNLLCKFKLEKIVFFFFILRSSIIWLYSYLVLIRFIELINSRYK